MSGKNDFWYQVRIISVVFAALFFLVALWCSIYFGLNYFKKNIVDNWGELQYNYVSKICNEVLKNKGESFTSDLKHKLEYTPSSYGFIYRNNKVVYERNNELTRMYISKSIRDLYGAYSYYGGSHLLEVLEKIEHRKSGIDYFVKNYDAGADVVSWHVFEIYGDNYTVGVATNSFYILELYKYNKIKNFVGVCAVVYSFFMVVFTIIMCISIFRNKIAYDVFRQENEHRNRVIKKMGGEIDILEEKFKALVTNDLLTQLYNMKFIDTLLDKVDADMILPVTILLFDVDSMTRFNDAYGYDRGDILLCGIADIIKRNISAEDIASRYKGDDFVVILTAKSEATANATMKKILFEMLEQCKPYGVDVICIRQTFNNADVGLRYELGRMYKALEKKAAECSERHVQRSV